MSSDWDQLLEHEYDGIREYDNPLPGWWVAIFWGTFIFSIVYFMWYDVGIGKGVYEDYDQARLDHLLLQAELYKDLEVTDATILEFQKDPDVMSSTAGIFNASCASCHREDGGGQIGPNLTDEYWLHDSSPTGIYTTIAEGVPAKGMQAWLDQLGPVQIMYLAAYIHGPMAGSNPANPKAPQGKKKSSE